MKAIPIWSTLIFIISCMVLYATGALSPIVSISSTDLKNNLFYFDEMGIIHQKENRISADVDETLGNPFYTLITSE